MELRKTNRGFGIIEFSDRNGVECSLQKSSIATEECIWLGCDNADPQVLVPGKGWQKIELPKEHIANTRMHLNQEQVRTLLPYLQKFASTGEIDPDMVPEPQEIDEKQPWAGKPIREWAKAMVRKYVTYLVGDKGWEKLGASHPDQLVDCTFAQIQVTLLGYADDRKEAVAKEEAIDRMLTVRE